MGKIKYKINPNKFLKYYYLKINTYSFIGLEHHF